MYKQWVRFLLVTPMLMLAWVSFAQSSESLAIEEVVVTATKREQSLQEVPVAVTALSSDALERAGVKDLRDLDNLATSFNMNSSQTETGGTTLRIRGVGTTGNNIGLESAVGVFLDGVYLSRPGIALSDLLDVEQIEVLRGPQGTLFGRNTSAGAISIRTQLPNTLKNEFFSNVTLGNYNARNLQAGASGPLSENLSYRLSGALRHQDGFLTSTTGAESRTRDRYSARGQLLWDISDVADLRLIVDRSDADERCCDAIVMQDSVARGLGSFTAAGLPADGGIQSFGDAALEGLESNAEQFENGSDQTGLSAELVWDLSDAIELTWLTSQRKFESTSVQQSDFVNLDVFSVGPQAGAGFPSLTTIDTTTSELRLAGETESLSWMVGVYYSDEDIHSQGALGLGADYSAHTDALLWRFALGPLLGPAQQLGSIALATGGTFADVLSSPTPSVAFAGGVNSAGSYAQNIFTQDGQSLSFFTHNTLRLTEEIDLVVGLRWIDETKDGAYRQAGAHNPACAATLANAGALIAGATGTPLADGAARIGGFSVAYACFPFAAPADVLPGRPQTFADMYEDDELAYTLKLTYDINEGTSSYVSYTHGYKSGGFNLDSTAAIGGADPRFNAETNDAWEGGLKTQFLDNRIRANFAAWTYDLEDFQVLEFTGIQFRTFNVPSAQSRGAELEMETLITERLSMSFGYTLAKSEYPDDCDGGGAQASPPVSSLCGAMLTNSPENTLTFGLAYEGEIGGLPYSVSSNFRQVSERRTSTQPNLDFDIQPSNQRLNLRAGIGSQDGRWVVEVWGQNVTDERVRNLTFSVPLRVGARASFIEAPRTYGVTLRTRF